MNIIIMNIIMNISVKMNKIMNNSGKCSPDLAVRELL